MSEERLRRQLQAQALVNRQLHAQLAELNAQLRAVQGNDASAVRVLWRRMESVLPRRVATKVERRVRGALGVQARPAGTSPAPRVTRSSSQQSTGEWLDDLRSAPPADTDPQLVQDAEGTTWLVEGTLRRPVTRMLVSALLETELGPARELTHEQLDELDDGPPVEVFAPPSGLPFVIVGGRRRPLAGYPVPFPIEDDDVSSFDEGEPLRVARIGRVFTPRAKSQRGAGGGGSVSALDRIRSRWPI